MNPATTLLHQIISIYESWLPDSGEGESDLRLLLDHLGNVGKPRPVPAPVPPVIKEWLEECCAQLCLPQHRDAIEILLEISSKLHWIAPSPEYTGEQMAQNYAFVRLIGPELFGVDSAPFYSDKVAVGFTILSPSLFYPPHWHPAVEFYGTLTGTGLWQLGDGPFEEKPPGTLIYHPSNVPHAMKTTDEPILTVYGWVGDILTRPVVEK